MYQACPSADCNKKVSVLLCITHMIVAVATGIICNSSGGANPKHAGICHLGMGKNGEKWGKMGQIKNFEIHV